MVPANQLPRVLREAALAAGDRVQDDFSRMVARLPDDARIRDDLERAIDDVHDPEVKKELQRVLRELDGHRDQLRWALGLSASQALDLVRTVATDVESGLLMIYRGVPVELHSQRVAADALHLDGHNLSALVV